MKPILSFQRKTKADRVVYMRELCPPGIPDKLRWVQTGAAVLQAPYELGFENEILDSYWTVPIYHNFQKRAG